jgi:hypothetical protein
VKNGKKVIVEGRIIKTCGHFAFANCVIGNQLLKVWLPVAAYCLPKAHWRSQEVLFEFDSSNCRFAEGAQVIVELGERNSDPNLAWPAFKWVYKEGETGYDAIRKLLATSPKQTSVTVPRQPRRRPAHQSWQARRQALVIDGNRQSGTEELKPVSDETDQLTELSAEELLARAMGKANARPRDPITGREMRHVRHNTFNGTYGNQRVHY